MLKRSEFVGRDEDPRLVKLAKKLAKCYRVMLKGRCSVYHNPFKQGVPLEAQSVFTHFVNAAKIVTQEKATCKSFLRAQFQGIQDVRQSAFPFPAQLASFNARLRYLEYKERKRTAKDQEVTEDDMMHDEYELQQLKLDDMRAGTKLSEREVLKMFKSEFSRAFLNLKGAR